MPVPDVWFGFHTRDVKLRRGSITLIGAAPGVGKSVMALVIALRSGLQTQYHAMDSDPNSVLVRLVSSAVPIHMSQAEQEVAQDGMYAQMVYDQVNWIDFQFPSSPDVDELVRRTWAHAEIHGRFPELIVVDNLMDIDFDGFEKDAHPWIVKQLEKLAARTEAAVLILCHVTGEYESGDRPIPQSGFLYKIAKKATLALTLYHRSATELVVSVVKNRWGEADASGTRVQVVLARDYGRMQITDVDERR